MHKELNEPKWTPKYFFYFFYINPKVAHREGGGGVVYTRCTATMGYEVIHG